uniref:Uncharacterized protein n=1 Tax=Globodera pallida TaxID=36090 RepID=A0A183BY98_GLOPA
MTLFLIIFIALGNNIQPSLGTPPPIIDQGLELFKKCKETMAEGGDCSKHF